MFQRNIIKGTAVHLASISICLKPTTFFVKYTFVTRYGPTWGARSDVGCSWQLWWCSCRQARWSVQDLEHSKQARGRHPLVIFSKSEISSKIMILHRNSWFFMEILVWRGFCYLAPGGSSKLPKSLESARALRNPLISPQNHHQSCHEHPTSLRRP